MEQKATKHVINSSSSSASTTVTSLDSSFLTSRKETHINQVFHALIVFANVKEKERISTLSDLHVHAKHDPWQSVWRFIGGETRNANIDSIENRFKEAFALVEDALVERESFSCMNEQQEKSRHEMMLRVKNAQFIDRALEYISAAQSNIFRVLGKTYENDTHITARLKLLEQGIFDKMAQVKQSIVFLDQRQGVISISSE